MSGCLTPPLSPSCDGSRTPTRGAPEERDVRGEMQYQSPVPGRSQDVLEATSTSASTPRASSSGHSSVLWPARLDAALQATAQARQARQARHLAPNPDVPYRPRFATQTVHVDRPRFTPKGVKAAAALQRSVERADVPLFAAFAARLGVQRTVWGLRYDDYAVLRCAAAQDAAFGCLKLALAALPESEVCALMRDRGGMLVDAAARTGHIAYANWLIYTYGHGEVQLISER